MKTYYEHSGEVLTHILFIPPNLKEDKIIPHGIKVIGKEAFRGITSLSSLVIPDGVELIESGAFYQCSNLRSVYIPESVTWVADGAFADCTSLEFIHYGLSTVFGNFCFSNCPKLLYVEQGATKARTFYFPQHNQFAITIEQPQLSTEKYVVYQGRFSGYDFPSSEANLAKPLMYFAETKDHKHIWYDTYLEDAITGCLFQASGLSIAEFYQKEFTPDSKITPREFSLLTGVCYEGRNLWVNLQHGSDETEYLIGDLLVTFQRYLPKVYERFAYLLAHQHESVNLLDLQNGLQWNYALTGSPWETKK